MHAIGIKRQALNELEAEYGEKLLGLEKCTVSLNKILKEKETLEKELDPYNPEGLLGAKLNQARDIINEGKSDLKHSKEVSGQIEKNLYELNELRGDLKKRFNKLNCYQTTLQYLKVIQHIENLCSELKQETSKKDDEKCVTLFANLTEILRLLSDCKVTHLKEHLNESILFWHNVLKEKLAKDFQEVLKQIKWPFLSANFSLVGPMEVNVDKLQLLSEYFLQIEIPRESNLPIDGPSGVLSNFLPPCLPIEMLIQPLRKRFLYHFYGNRKTNRPDRPEWYFTQILTWIRDHQEYVETWMQTVIEKFGLHHLDVKTEFTRGLVQLAAEKLNSELPSLQFDDFHFSHTINEALRFDKELKEVYNYPTCEPSIVVILTQASVLVKWLNMEKKYAMEKMDGILSSNTIEAFDLLTCDVEDLKITTCADAFITLLQTIAERYECLPQPGHRLQFLDLQLELLDDFRVRLLQIVNAEQGDYMETKVPMVANTLHYVEGVLVDWGSMLHYLNLYYYKTQLTGENNKYNTFSSPKLNTLEESATTGLETDSLFMKTLALYRRFRRDILSGLSKAVLIEVRKKSREYRREGWTSMKVGKDFRSLSLTPSACPMFEVLAKRLHQLQKKLQNKLFTAVWRNIATQLDTFLFEDLVMDNRFNEGGALQLKFDITRNLLPLFGHYTDIAANYFPQLIESSILLNLAKGSALLLRETLLALEEASGVEDTRRKMLKETGVNNFTPVMAVKVLNQRTDITVDRLYVD
ncbi:RAD50-interacting protein 1 [Euwallacea similis]|uniref:RAD50-interacting protein 1 n=1 Tax=Euwallacea similis TaxID=1736056 RepID=UPI00344C7D66